MTKDEIIDALLDVAQAAFWLMDGCCEHGDGTLTVPEEEVDALSKALDKLDELPDDKPGITMDGPGRAQWALTRKENRHFMLAVLGKARDGSTQCGGVIFDTNEKITLRVLEHAVARHCEGLQQKGIPIAPDDFVVLNLIELEG